MNLLEAKAFRSQCVRANHKSDGCTFVPDLIFFFACQMHDFLIRFKRVSLAEADSLYLEYMLELAGYMKRYKLVAYIYYSGVRIVNTVFFGNFMLAVAFVFFTIIFSIIYFIEV